VIILVVALLIFGPSKLPQLGEGIGKMLRGFKKEMKSLEDDDAKDKASKTALADQAAPEGEEHPGEIDVTPNAAPAEKAKTA
jgi:sec-independent protein translocase protein TatA